jgi:hypothetical protein
MNDPTDHLLDKMQALMGKHRDASLAQPESMHEAAQGDTRSIAATPFPVLTDIVRRGDFAADAAIAPVHDDAALEPVSPQITTLSEPPAPALSSPEQAEQLASAVAAHVLGMLDGHFEHQVNTVITQRLRRVIDDSLSTLLTQLALDTESIVRDAVQQELARHGIHPSTPPETPANPV